MSLNVSSKINYGVSFVGSGSATPSQVIHNDQLGLRVDTNDSWIKTRTGICTRCVVGPQDSLTDISYQAGRNALEMAKWSPESLDMIIFATSTPDDLFGSATQIQAKLEAINSVAFDLTAACSGFLFSLVTAAQFIQNGSMKRVLVIGGDQLSRWVDWDDRRSCILFGDGAGAIAIESSKDKQGLIGFKLKSDGARGGCLNLPQTKDFEKLAGNYLNQKGGFSPIKMNGQEVYKFAISEVPLILEEILNKHNVEPQSLDWLLLHQANQRILDSVAKKFAIPSRKVLTNLANYGNTSAATIPLMLDEAIRDGRVKSGDLIASSGFGAGLSWGGALFRWHGPS